MTFRGGQRVTIGAYRFRTGTVIGPCGPGVYLVWTAGVVARVEARDMAPRTEAR